MSRNRIASSKTYKEVSEGVTSVILFGLMMRQYKKQGKLKEILKKLQVY
ncbi:MAG: hypothetical protein U9N18_07400 [Campylobacterota bacterium]|nr:hypothetical protein [Campylobacterota bacterium]